MTLFWLGLTLDVIGILLVAAGDYWPEAADLGRSIGAALASFRRWIARRLGRRVTHYASSGGVIVLGGSVRGVVSISEGASLDEKVAFLLRRVEDLQKQHDDLAETVAKFPKDWAADLAAATAELKELLERRLTEAQRRYLRARQVGLILLVVGNVLLAASNAL